MQCLSVVYMGSIFLIYMSPPSYSLFISRSLHVNELASFETVLGLGIMCVCQITPALRDRENKKANFFFWGGGGWYDLAQLGSV